MARLYLIRHGPTPSTGKVAYGRLPGHHLSPEGAAAARRLGHLFGPIPLAAIYTSPMERAVETAEAIAAGRRLRPRLHEGLNEIDHGTWTGRSLSSLRRLSAWSTVLYQPSRLAFPGGETLAAAQTRMVAACEEIAARHRGKAVALVSHGDLIKAAVSHFIGQPFDLFQRLVPSPLGVSVLDLPRTGIPRLLSWNWTLDGGWLPSSGREGT